MADFVFSEDQIRFEFIFHFIDRKSKSNPKVCLIKHMCPSRSFPDVILSGAFTQVESLGLISFLGGRYLLLNKCLEFLRVNFLQPCLYNNSLKHSCFCRSKAEAKNRINLLLNSCPNYK